MILRSQLTPAVAGLLLATLLAACSGSDRVEHIVPAWANSPPPTSRYQARKDRGPSPEGQPQTVAEPREPPKPNPPGPAEE
jgi:hypothetical protein